MEHCSRNYSRILKLENKRQQSKYAGNKKRFLLADNNSDKRYTHKNLTFLTKLTFLKEINDSDKG